MEIDVLVAIDADTIQQVLGANADPDKPVGIGSAHATVVTSAGGKTTLGVTDLTVEEGDTIRWWVDSPGFRYACVIYRFIDEKTQQPLTDTGIISAPRVAHFAATDIIPNQADPLTPQLTKNVPKYCWVADVQDAGRLTYGIEFAVYKYDGTRVGYYQYVGRLTSS